MYQEIYRDTVANLRRPTKLDYRATASISETSEYSFFYSYLREIGRMRCFEMESRLNVM